MTLVSCNLVPVTLKAVWAEIPAVCFCVKYHTARPPEQHQGRPDQAAGRLLTPPLKKTNSLTMKHLSPSPSLPLLLSSVSHNSFIYLYSLLFPLNDSCFPTAALSHKAVSLDVFVYCVTLTVYFSGDVPCWRSSIISGHSPFDITLFSSLGIKLLSSYHLSKSCYCSSFRGPS